MLMFEESCRCRKAKVNLVLVFVMSEIVCPNRSACICLRNVVCIARLNDSGVPDQGAFVFVLKL